MLNRRLFVSVGTAALLAPTQSWALAARAPGDPRLNNHPELASALGLLQSARWAELTGLVAGLPPDSACVLLDDLGDQSDVDIDLSGLVDTPMARTVRGALLVNWGWRYRGSGFASTVTDEMGQAFEERLRRAREDLQAAVAADPHDGVAYMFLIRTLKGLSAVDALSPTWEAFLNADRKPIRAYAGCADALAAKWFGSNELMLGFARTYQRSLEPASHALIAQVCNEIMLSVLRRNGSEAAVSFAAQQAVLGEVGAASEAFRALPAPEDFYQGNFGFGEFSFYFSFLGLNDHARPFLQAMGDKLSGPWSLMDDPFAILERARLAAGLSTT